MGRISAQLRSDKPNLAVVAENAMVLDTVNKLFVSAFPEGSAVGNSRAKPEIWKDQARFNQYATRLDGDVAKLVAAAKSGDPAAARSAFQAVGQVCKACHDDFRRD
jgi:cytochrome c556